MTKTNEPRLLDDLGPDFNVEEDVLLTYAGGGILAGGFFPARV